jgi:tetratricopeptide (TPR) repeat protein
MGVCSFFTACYYAADFERAEAWIDDLRRVGIMGERSTGPVWITGHCESVQATALIELGRWTDAESLLTSSLEAFETATGWPAWHPAIALADLRTRQGRLAEAEALLAGKDAHMQALLPTARLRLALGEYELATATARRGLRMVGGDRLRGVDLLTIVIEAEARAGRLAEAEEAWRELESRDGSPREPGLAARVAHARSAVLMATGDVGQAITVVETAAASLAGGKWLVLQLMLTLDLLALHTAAGNDAVAAIEAKRAQALLTDLDVTLPEATLEILNRHLGVPASITGTTARLRRIDGRWVAETTGTVVRLRATKGLLYLAELLAAPGVERHVIDLVDRVEGVDRDGVDRKQIGHAGEVADATARASYRTRIEALRTQIDEALESEDDERVASLQAECDALVGELAAAFGLGGRGRLVSSAAERARLNVTRAIRTAIAGIAELLPHEGGVLDERVRTGMYCAFEPARTDLVHWSFSSD